MRKSLFLCTLLTMVSSASFAATTPSTTCSDSTGTMAAANAKGQCKAGMSPVGKPAGGTSTAAAGESQGGPVASVTTFKPAVTSKTIAAAKAAGK